MMSISDQRRPSKSVTSRDQILNKLAVPAFAVKKSEQNAKSFGPEGPLNSPGISNERSQSHASAGLYQTLKKIAKKSKEFGADEDTNPVKSDISGHLETQNN